MTYTILTGPLVERMEPEAGVCMGVRLCADREILWLMLLVTFVHHA
jgi:hypothetical protein